MPAELPAADHAGKNIEAKIPPDTETVHAHIDVQ